jgi:hypothetical protein
MPYYEKIAEPGVAIRQQVFLEHFHQLEWRQMDV